MSQNDFNLANQGFPSMRSDMNSAFQALASTSAGATAPSTTYAYQLWYDTSTNLLKMRNADNDGFITLAAFDQTNDEWEVRSAVIQAVDAAGVIIKTDDGVARISVADSGDVTVANALTVDGDLTVDTDTLFVDATNNRVGVGMTSPTHKLTVAGYSNVDASNKLAIGDNAGYQGLIYMESANETLTIENTSDYSGRATIFKDNGAERLRIDSSGNLLVGTTSAQPAAAPLQGNIVSVFSGSAKHGLNITTSTSGTSTLVHFGYTAFGTLGSITTNASSTSYNTTSDYRLKENVAPLAGAADRLAQIPVHRFNFIADPDTTVDGFLAHEVQDVVPEAVTGEKDAVETVDVTDEDGNVTGTEDRPVHQGIDQSKLVPLLTAALQEALAEITDLKTRVAALEAV